MPTPLKNAEKKLALLRAEIARVERFIADYKEFSGEDGISDTPVLNGAGGNERPPVDNVEKPRMSRRRGLPPDEIAQMVERVIREVGHPMTRGEIVEALERRDVDLPTADKARYVGTIIWRHKAVFVNIEGRGYWLRSELRNVPGVAPGTPYSDPTEDDTEYERGPEGQKVSRSDPLRELAEFVKREPIDIDEFERRMRGPSRS